MKKILSASFIVIASVSLFSCGQTTQQDNTTHSNDTMVIKQNQTDSATKSVSTDTTKR